MDEPTFTDAALYVMDLLETSGHRRAIGRVIGEIGFQRTCDLARQARATPKGKPRYEMFVRLAKGVIPKHYWVEIFGRKSVTFESPQLPAITGEDVNAELDKLMRQKPRR